MDQNIQVGYGRVDIMPEGSIELGGLGNGPFRKSENILDTLYATCIAITDSQDQTLLLITMDLLHAMQGMVADMRAIITEKTGVPGEHIMIAATHTHAGPDIFNPGPKTVDDYIVRCVNRVPLAAEAALADRKPARAFTAVKQLEDMNFVRHYKRADGTCGGDLADNPWVGHMTQADPRMRVVQFRREEGKDILLMNWQAHPCFTGQAASKNISADYIASVRGYLEVMLGCHFAFFQGAGGNLTARSKIKTEVSYREMDEYGKHLGDAAISALENVRELELGPLQTVRRRYLCPVDHSTDGEVPQAAELWNFWLTANDIPESYRRARELGYGSPYQGRAVLERASKPEAEELELNAVRLGELAFATAPCEMFDTCGAYVKDNSPFENTLMLAYCNGSYGYFPTKYAFEYRCYESDTHKYAPGSAEEMAENLVEMLRTLK